MPIADAAKRSLKSDTRTHWNVRQGTVSGTEWSILLVHPILVGGCLGDDLQDVPVLNDFAVLSSRRMSIPAQLWSRGQTW